MKTKHIAEERHPYALTLAILAFLLVTFACKGMGQAALSAAGPINPTNTLPAYFQDGNGLALTLCLDQNGLCVLPPEFDQTITPGAPAIVFPSNFPDETFWWTADATMDVGPNLTEPAVLGLALETAFLSLPVTPGEGITFLRINLKQLSGLTPNSTYTVTHPFGSFTFPTDALGDAKNAGGQAYRAEDGCFGPPCLTFPQLLAAATTSIGPFLRAANPLPPAGYIGDPRINQTVTGGTNGNEFRIDGPDIGGPGVDTISTPLFSISGKIFNGRLATPLIVDRTTYNRGASGAVEIFATSATTAVVKVSGGPNLPATPVTLAKKDANGHFYKRIQLADASTLPSTVTLSAANAGNRLSTVSSPLVDVVTITEANYNARAQTLTIGAVSSDESPTTPPTLTATGYGALVDGTLTVPLLAIPPAMVTVTSSAGGADSKLVNVAPRSISGKVTKAGGKGVAGVAVTLDGPSAAVTITDLLGQYSFPNLANGDYTVTPSLTNFTFTPASTAVTLSGLGVNNINFAMTGLSIKGTIRSAAKVAMPGVTVALSGDATATTTTNARGVYTFNTLPDNSTFTITPSKAGTTFNPLTREVSTAGVNIVSRNFTEN